MTCGQEVLFSIHLFPHPSTQSIKNSESHSSISYQLSLSLWWRHEIKVKATGRKDDNDDVQNDEWLSCTCSFSIPLPPDIPMMCVHWLRGLFPGTAAEGLQKFINSESPLTFECLINQFQMAKQWCFIGQELRVSFPGLRPPVQAAA